VKKIVKIGAVDPEIIVPQETFKGKIYSPDSKFAERAEL